MKTYKRTEYNILQIIRCDKDMFAIYDQGKSKNGGEDVFLALRLDFIGVATVGEVVCEDGTQNVLKREVLPNEVVGLMFDRDIGSYFVCNGDHNYIGFYPKDIIDSHFAKAKVEYDG